MGMFLSLLYAPWTKREREKGTVAKAMRYSATGQLLHVTFSFVALSV